MTIRKKPSKSVKKLVHNQMGQQYNDVNKHNTKELSCLKSK
jgi:hypothetical protein